MFDAAAIILAGGRSSRMGSPKMALDWHGSTLLRRVTGLARRAVDGPVVVVGAPGQQLPVLDRAVEVVADAHEGRGPLQGLATGLQAIGDRAPVAFVSATDVPLLHPAFIRHVLGAFTPGIDVVLPEIGGFRQALSAGYRTALLPTVQALLAAGTLRLTGLLDRCAVLSLDAGTMVRDPHLAGGDPELASVSNLNERRDYERALALPAPSIRVHRSVSLAAEAASREQTVPAWTLGQLAEDLGYTLDGDIVVTLNGDRVPGDRWLPLVAGDTVSFTALRDP